MLKNLKKESLYNSKKLIQYQQNHNQIEDKEFYIRSFYDDFSLRLILTLIILGIVVLLRQNNVLNDTDYEKAMSYISANTITIDTIEP